MLSLRCQGRMKQVLNKIIHAYPDEEFLKADGLDEAVIGVEEDEMRLVYSVDKCIEIFMTQGMEYDEALEFFDYNVRGAWMGDKTPIWVKLL
jgi:hypothetical protein